MSIMAGNDNTRNVQVVVSGNVSGFQQAMQAAGSSVNTLASGVETLGKKINDLSRRTGRRLELFSTADVAGLSAAAEATNRLDVAMSGVRTTAAITGQSVSAATSAVQRLSRSIPDSTNNIARLMGQVQNMGITGTKNLQNFTETAERLGAATATAPGELLQGVVQLNREMGNGLPTVNRYSSALIELSKTAGVNASGILNFANYIDAVAQQAGYTETQVLGLATAFNRAGADSSQAANVFVSITSQIQQAVQTNSTQLNQFANLAGMTRQAFLRLSQDNPAQAFIKVLEGIHQEGQRGIITLQQLGLDGPRSLRVIAALTSGQANLSQQMNTASSAYDRNTALTKASNSAWDSFSSTMAKFRNNMAGVVTAIGGPFLAVLNTMFKAVNGLVDAFNSIPGIHLFEEIVGGALAVIAPLAAMLGLLLKVGPAMLLALATWRNLTGATGANLTSGIASGVRGRPGTLFGREFSDNRLAAISGSRYQQRLYEAGYGVGGVFGRRRAVARQNAAAETYGPEGASYVTNPSAAGRVARSIAFFPLSKLRGEVGEALDTARPSAFADYTQRNVHANPYSALSVIKRAEEVINRGQGQLGGLVDRVGQTGLGTLTGAAASSVSGHLLRAGRWGTDMAGSLLSRVKVTADTTEAEAKIDRVARTRIVTIRANPQGGFVATEGEGAAAAVAPATSPGLLGRFGSMAGATARAGGGLVSGLFNGLGTFASALSSVIFPLTILGTAGGLLYHVFTSMAEAGRKYADNLDDLGAAAARSAGGSYTKPVAGLSRVPADQIKAFSPQDRAIALSGSFTGANQSDLAQLERYGGNMRQTAAQAEINNLVRVANSGQPLSQSQRNTVRQQLIAAYGVQAAQQIMGRLNTSGQSGKAAAATAAALIRSARDDSGFFQGAFQGKGSQAQFRQGTENLYNAYAEGDFGTTATGWRAIAQGLGLPSNRTVSQARRISDIEMRSSGGYAVRTNLDDLGMQGNVQRFRGAIEQFLDQVNKGRASNQQIHVDRGDIFNFNDFLSQLRNGSRAAKDLAGALSDTKTAAKTLSETLAAQVSSTPLGGLLSTLGVNFTSPNDVNYQRNLFLTQQFAQQPGNFLGNANQTPVNRVNTPGLTNVGATERGIRNVEAYVVALRKVGDPSASNAASMIANLNGQLQNQVGLFQDAAQQAQTYAGVAAGMVNRFASTPEAAPEVQGALTQANQSNLAGIAQLHQYVIQVHNAHIQIQREQQDHNIQLTRMFRDFNVQQKEAFYQRNLQVQQQLHDFNEQIRQMNFQTEQAFGNGAQMVPSQYTMGAQNALLGMNQQVHLLEESLTSLNQLRRMGVGSNVIRILGLDDPTNADQAARYVTELANNPALIRAWNTSANKRLKLANLLDTNPDNSKYREMKRQFDYAANLATRAFQHSQQVTKQAFERGLGDFNTDYQISQQRTEEDLQRTAENLYTNLNQLMQAAQDTGIHNIQVFASRLHDAIAQVRHDTNKYLHGAINDANSAANNIGSGVGGGVGGVGSAISNAALGPSSGGGVNAHGSAVGDTGVVQQQTKSTRVGGSHIGQNVTTSSRTYVRPGTGFVYKGGSNANPGGCVSTAGAYVYDYRPSSQFMRQHPENPSFNKSIGKSMAASRYGWTGNEFQALDELWGQKESGWLQYNQNPHSPAYGIPQSCPGPKMASAGSDWRTNPATQIKWGLDYIKRTYGTPTNVLRNYHSGYYMGSVFDKRTTIDVGEAGPEAVIPLNNVGASFVSNVVNKVIGMSGVGKAQVAMTQTMPRASVVINGNVSHAVNNNTNFSGDITVQAQDPNEMARKLAQKKRLQRLTNPSGVK